LALGPAFGICHYDKYAGCESNIYIRESCKSKTPTFIPLYILSQFATATLLCLSLGTAKSSTTSNFDDASFFDGLITRYDNSKVVLLLVGGFLLANGDFLFACTYSHLPFAVAFPIYGAWGLVEGTVLNYMIEGEDTAKPMVLFLGVFSALVAILFMALSDYFSNAVRAGCDNGGEVNTPDASNTANGISDNVHSSDKERASLGEAGGGRVNPYIGVCLLAGVFSGLWSPLSARARQGDGRVDNPYVALLLFMTGQVLALPLLLAYYVLVFERGGHSGAAGVDDDAPEEDGDASQRGERQLLEMGHVYSNSSGSSVPTGCELHHLSRVGRGMVVSLLDTMALPLRDKFFGMLAGGIVGVGYTCLFVASESATTTVAFAIACCDPLVAIAIGVIFFGQLRRASTNQAVSLYSSVSLFAAAIFFFVFSMHK
jgi:drug/metabolite transporter (DMT)-like permease